MSKKKSLFKSPSVPCLVRNRGVRPAHLSDSLGNGHTWLEMRRYSSDTSPRAMAATLRAPREAASRRHRRVSRDAAPPAVPSPPPRRRRPGDPRWRSSRSTLDDTLWPTTPVVMAANQAFVDFCQERIPFPDCAGSDEYMKVSARRARPEPSERVVPPRPSPRLPR